MRAQLRYQGSGTLTHTIREGRPDETPSAVLYDRAGAALATPTVTSDPVDTTLASGAADGAVTLTLTSATGVVPGDEYLVSGGGRSAWTRVLSVSGAVVTLADGLAGAFASGATFQSTRVTIPVTSASTGTLEENRYAVLTYEVGGVEYTDHAYFDVVRSPWPLVVLSTAEYRRLVGPMAAAELERDGAQDLRFADEIAQATELVRLDIADRNLRPDLFLSHEPFARPIAHRVLLEQAYLGSNIPHAWQDSPEAYLQMCAERYEKSLSLALNTARTYDANQDGTVQAAEAGRRLSTVRITR